MTTAAPPNVPGKLPVFAARPSGSRWSDGLWSFTGPLLYSCTKRGSPETDTFAAERMATLKTAHRPSLTQGLACAAVLAAALAVLLISLGETPPTTQKELRVWKATSGMYASGDYLVPRVDGSPHLTKPPLYYWAAVLCAKAFSRMDLFTLRLPSVIAAVGTLLVVSLWAYRLGGAQASVLAPALLLSMGRFPDWARHGTFEMMLVFFSVSTLYAFHLAYERRSLPIFALCCGCLTLGFLTKGTAVLLTAVLPAALYVLTCRELRVLRRPAAWGLIAASAVGSLAWFGVLAWRVPEAREIFRTQILLPFGVETEMATATHYEPFYYYAPAIVMMAFPVSAFLPIVLYRAWRTRVWRDEGGYRLLFITFAAILVAFSLIKGKQGHYVFTCLAPMALLTAESLLGGLSADDGLTRRWVGASAVAWGVGLMLLPAPVVFFAWIVFGWHPGEAGGLAAALAVAGIFTMLAGLRGRWKSAFGWGFAGTVALYLFVFGSFAVWDAQFYTSAVTSRPDYDAAKWAANFEKYPSLKKIFRSQEGHEFRMPPAEAANRTPGEGQQDP